MTTNDVTAGRHVCAHRVLESSFGQVTVTMDVPVVDPESGDFACRYEIQGPRTRRRSHAMGIDAFQAIELAMQKIGTDLMFSEEGQSGGLRWLDEPYVTGFPLPPSIKDLDPSS